MPWKPSFVLMVALLVMAAVSMTAAQMQEPDSYADLPGRAQAPVVPEGNGELLGGSEQYGGGRYGGGRGYGRGGYGGYGGRGGYGGYGGRGGYGGGRYGGYYG